MDSRFTSKSVVLSIREGNSEEIGNSLAGEQQPAYHDYVRGILVDSLAGGSNSGPKKEGQIPTLILMDFEIEQSFLSTVLETEEYPLLRSIHQGAIQKVKRQSRQEQQWLPILQLPDPADFSLEHLLYREYAVNCLTPQQLEAEGYLLSQPPCPGKVVLPFHRKLLSLDCEMVETTAGTELARATLVDYHFNIIYDQLVKPSNQIKDYRTSSSGITKQLMKQATKTLEEVQNDLSQLFSHEAILIGHSLQNDLRALRMAHHRIIDTAVLYQRNGCKIKLKQLAYEHLNKAAIQRNTHDSAEDCRHTLALAKLYVEVLQPLNGVHSIRSVAHPTKQTLVIVDNPSSYIGNIATDWSYHISDSLEESVKLVDFKRHGLVLVGKDCSDGDWSGHYLSINNAMRQLQAAAPKGTKFVIAAKVSRRHTLFVPGRPVVKQDSYCLSFVV